MWALPVSWQSNRFNCYSLPQQLLTAAVAREPCLRPNVLAVR